MTSHHILFVFQLFFVFAEKHVKKTPRHVKAESDRVFNCSSRDFSIDISKWSVFVDKVCSFCEWTRDLWFTRAMTAKIYFVFNAFFHNLYVPPRCWVFQFAFNETAIIAVELSQSVTWRELSLSAAIQTHSPLFLLIQRLDKDSFWKWWGSFAPLYIIFTVFYVLQTPVDNERDCHRLDAQL